MFQRNNDLVLVQPVHASWATSDPSSQGAVGFSNDQWFTGVHLLGGTRLG